MAYENKTKPTDAGVAAFLDTVEHPVRRADAETLLAMMREVSGEEPVMWGPSIIGFGAVHYRYETGHEGDMPVIAFSPRKAHQVLYLMYGTDENTSLLDALGKYKMGKACMYVNKLADVDLDVLRKLVELTWVEVPKQPFCEVCRRD